MFFPSYYNIDNIKLAAQKMNILGMGEYFVQALLNYILKSQIFKVDVHVKLKINSEISRINKVMQHVQCAMTMSL